MMNKDFFLALLLSSAALCVCYFYIVLFSIL